MFKTKKKFPFFFFLPKSNRNEAIRAENGCFYAFFFLCVFARFQNLSPFTVLFNMHVSQFGAILYFLPKISSN